MYAKVFRSLWEGSLRGQPDEQLVFVFMLAHADANGVVDVIHRVIVDGTGLSDHRVRAAIRRLESEDPTSRTPDEAGKRIARMDEHRDWGWLIVNYPKYRSMSDIERVREQTRLRVRRFRERRSTSRSVTKRHVTRGNADNAPLRQAEAEADAEAEVDRSVGAHGSSAPVPELELTPPSVRDPDAITSEQAFEELFWPLYPRKVAKHQARKVWLSLKLDEAKHGQEILEAILAGLRRDIAQEWKDRDRDKIPHAGTWLFQRRWES